MSDYRPMTTLPPLPGYHAGDVLVLFGELFGRGYANGLVAEARRLGMTILGTTVGRRDSDGSLRPLTPEELAEAETLLGGTIINIPLEAGFDMETPDGQPSISDRLKKAKPDEWEQVSFPDGFISQAQAAGQARFTAAVARLADELADRVPAGADLLLAHTMAGGIPRARFFMPLLNRVFKGIGDKHLPSAPFWQSQVGQLCDASFNEVTADTFRYLLEGTAGLRNRIEAAGGRTAYSAYGYHGTGILLDGAYRWQSYTPYLQGFAKMRLEGIAAEARQQGINATVFNCPEIQTNSSALFLGVELSLYPLLHALRSAAGATAALEARCTTLLQEGATLATLLAEADNYLTNPLITAPLDFAGWPQHSTRDQMELMLAASNRLMAMHRDSKQLVCAELSRLVFRATGRLILHGSWSSQEAAFWLNHDLIATLLADPRGADLLD